MEKFNLTAEIRSLDVKNKELRNNKKIPAVVYGKNQEPISIVLEYSDFLKTFRKSGESNIINLNVGKKDIEVLVHDFQQEPVTGDYTHVDFYAVTRGETLTTKIQLNFVGDSPAVKEGGILEELNKEIEVKCLPKDLVNHFDVDLNVLNEVGDNIKVSDLKLGDKFEILTPATEVLVLVGKSKAEKVETEATEDNTDTEETSAE
jgi:large subunit ribosomal protein L25